QESAFKRVSNALVIHYRETKLIIQGQEEQIPIKPLDIEILLTDSNYQPIKNQEIFLECYRENSTINLLGSRISVRTNASGVALYSLPLLLPDDYILYAYYQPQSDSITKNNGFLDSEASFRFKIVRIAANLMVKQLGKPFIMRGDILDITVVSESEAAKDYLIPVRIFVDGMNFDHVDVLGLMTIKKGVGRFSYEVPLGPGYQAGIYKFTIEIEPGSFFEGNTSFHIDLRERTTLTISYNILNPRAHGNHYIWEQEEILFTLLDEDGKPLPDSCENESVDRLIRYQIINGQYVTDIKETGLFNGSFSLYNKPKKIGDEYCIGRNNGSRFFAPAYQKRIADILRRPLILIYSQYWHNNPKRADLPHTGHRRETLFIEAFVKDYLNLTLRPYHKVNFGYNGMLKEYYDVSDENGYVKIEVPLNTESGLIQADTYNPFLKIVLTTNFQSIINQSLETLRILEFGQFDCQVGDIIPIDGNYLLKPTIRFYDEDNQEVKDFAFYIRYVKIENGEIYTKKNMKSGTTKIPVSAHGEFKIVITMTSDDTGYSLDNDTIASYMINKTLISAIKAESSKVSVWSPLTQPFYIPIWSDILLPSLWISIEWRAGPITIAIWFILFILFGTERVYLTWISFFLFIITIVALHIFDSDDPFTRLMLRFGLIAGINMITEILEGSNWFFSVVKFLIAMAATYAIKEGLKKIYDKFEPEEREELLKKKWYDVKVLLLELLLTFFYGLWYRTARGWGFLGKAFKWLLSWLWTRKRRWQGEMRKPLRGFFLIPFIALREYISMKVDDKIPKPKKDDIF
ncbi:MAG: hypothetical protein ACXABG_15605, partial [Promethearchaeota archaeon]